jgi:predicted dehydrogenase
MKICFVGLGSIGRRHLGNLYNVLLESKIQFDIDAFRSSQKEVGSDIKRLLHKEYYSYDDLPDNYDIAFITNPTSLHFETIQKMMLKARHLFIEKPVFDGTGYDINNLRLRNDGVYYVACPLRYSSVIKFLKEFVLKNDIYSARGICSTYLPNWRPNTDYRQCYSAKSEAGGGVRIDLIHEWDYLQYLFGIPLDIAEYHGTHSHLEITSDDTAAYIARYNDKLISLHLDYYGRVNRRELELYLQDDVIIGDLINQNIRFLKSGKVINLPQDRDDMQKDEIKRFFDIINGQCQNENDIHTAFRTLNLALGRILP